MKKLPEKCDEEMPYFQQDGNTDMCKQPAHTCMKCMEKYLRRDAGRRKGGKK